MSSLALWLLSVFKTLVRRKREGSGTIPQALCLLGLLGLSVSPLKVMFPFCLKVASSPGFSAVSKTQSYTAVVPLLLSSHTFVSSLSVNKRCFIPSPVDLPDPGIEPRHPALQAASLPTQLSVVP